MTETVAATKSVALFESPKPGFALTRDDYSAWLKREAREGWRGPAGLFGFSLFVGAATFFGAGIEGRVWRLEVSLIAVAILFAAGLFHSSVSRRLAVARWTPPGGAMTVEVNPYRDELAETNGETVRAYRWIEVKEALRDPAHLFVVLRDAPVIIIPKSAFAGEDAAESFARFIDQRSIGAEDSARDAANPNAPD